MLLKVFRVRREVFLIFLYFQLLNILLKLQVLAQFLLHWQRLAGLLGLKDICQACFCLFLFSEKVPLFECLENPIPFASFLQNSYLYYKPNLAFGTLQNPNMVYN